MWSRVGQTFVYSKNMNFGHRPMDSKKAPLLCTLSLTITMAMSSVFCPPKLCDKAAPKAKSPFPTKHTFRQQLTCKDLLLFSSFWRVICRIPIFGGLKRVNLNSLRIKMKILVVLFFCLVQLLAGTTGSHTHYTHIIIFNHSLRDLVISGFNLSWGKFLGWSLKTLKRLS